MADRPVVVAFDVLGTLYSLEPLRARMVQAGLPQDSLQMWRARTLRDGFAITLAGDFRTFHQVAESTLEQMLLERNLDTAPARLERIMDGFEELELHPDARQALQTLKEAGMRLVLLTNCSSELSRQLMRKSGLNELIERDFSIDEVGFWKPHPASYRHVAAQLTVMHHRVALVAEHPWDIMGAHRAGLVTGWVSRQTTRFPDAMGDYPDVAGSSLGEVATDLLELPTREPEEMIYL